MCNKCGNVSINSNKAQESIIKMQLAQNHAGGIAQLAFGAISLFGNGFEADYSSERPTTKERTQEVQEEAEEKTDDTAQLKKEVVEILEKAEYEVPDDILEEVIKKYSMRCRKAYSCLIISCA